MARPKKETELAKKHQVKILFSDTQYAVITEDARRVGLPLAVYLRDLITEHGLKLEYKIVRDDEQLHKAITQLSRIGNILNQMMRYFHKGGLLTPEIKKDLHDGIREIYTLSEVFDKMDSDTTFAKMD